MQATGHPQDQAGANIVQQSGAAAVWCWGSAQSGCEDVEMKAAQAGHAGDGHLGGPARPGLRFCPLCPLRPLRDTKCPFAQNVDKVEIFSD